MIPFEEEPGLTPVEQRAQEKLEANWQHVIRATPGIKEDFQERFPELSKQVNEKIREDTEPGNLFRPGIPDFLAFNDSGHYKFVEVKGEGDGLRHSQLKWINDFQGINLEIWYADSNESATQKIKGGLDAYSLKDAGKTGQASIREEDQLLVELPESLASIMELEPGHGVSCKIKYRSRLILETD